MKIINIGHCEDSEELQDFCSNFGTILTIKHYVYPLGKKHLITLQTKHSHRYIQKRVDALFIDVKCVTVTDHLTE